MNRKAATQLVSKYGAKVVAAFDGSVDIIVLGDREYLGEKWQQLHQNDPHDFGFVQENNTLAIPQIISESDFWTFFPAEDVDFSGLERDSARAGSQAETRLFTPSMMASFLSVTATQIHHWYRLDLLRAKQVIGQLPYFDSSELVVAHHLAKLHATGCRTTCIARAVDAMKRRGEEPHQAILKFVWHPNHNKLLLASANDLIDQRGQHYLEFESEDSPEVSSNNIPTTNETHCCDSDFYITLEQRIRKKMVEICESAWDLVHQGQLQEAIKVYRGVILTGGSDPGISLQLGELLEQTGELAAARERYYMVLEQDEHFVEARFNLGRVLARLGEEEEAIAALIGVIDYQFDHLEAHFELGHLYYRAGKYRLAEDHLRYYLTSTHPIRGELAEHLLAEIESQSETG